MTDIVNQRPRNLEKLWEFWTKHRLSTQLKDDTQSVPESESKTDFVIRRESSSVDSNGPAFVIKVLDGDFKSIVEKATSNKAETIINDEGKFALAGPKASSSKFVVGDVTFKTYSGIDTEIIGSSQILSQSQVDQLESGLPRDYQCNNWRLLYRLTKDGADLSTLVRKAKSLDKFLLVIKDLSGKIKKYVSFTLYVFIYFDNDNNKRMYMYLYIYIYYIFTCRRRIWCVDPRNQDFFRG